MRSPVVIGLFVLAAAMTSTAQIALHPLPIESPDSGEGIAVAFNRVGELAALIDSPERLLVWDRDGRYLGESPCGAVGRFQPSDLASDGGFGFLAVDPLAGDLVSFGRRGANPSAIAYSGRERIEPFSVAVDRRGTPLLLDRLMGGIYRLEADRRLSSFHPILTRSVRRIAASSDGDALLLLDSAAVRVFHPFSRSVRTFPVHVSEPVGLAAADGVVWVVGRGWEGLSEATGESLLEAPEEALKDWGVFPAADCAASAGRLAILGVNGKVVLFEVVPRAAEK